MERVYRDVGTPISFWNNCRVDVKLVATLLKRWMPVFRVCVQTVSTNKAASFASNAVETYSVHTVFIRRIEMKLSLFNESRVAEDCSSPFCHRLLATVRPRSVQKKRTPVPNVPRCCALSSPRLPAMTWRWTASSSKRSSTWSSRKVGPDLPVGRSVVEECRCRCGLDTLSTRSLSSLGLLCDKSFFPG